MGKTAVFVLVAFALMGGVAHAEFADARIFIVSDAGDNRETGYRYPFVGFGGGFAFQTDKILIDVQNLVSFTDKYHYADIHQLYGEGRCILVAHGVGFGGGVTWARILFGELSVERASLRPFVSAGLVRRRGFILVEWVFSGEDEAYSVQRPRISAEIAPFATKSIRTGIQLSYPVYRNSTNNVHGRGLEMNVYLKLILPARTRD